MIAAMGRIVFWAAIKPVSRHSAFRGKKKETTKKEQKREMLACKSENFLVLQMQTMFLFFLPCYFQKLKNLLTREKRIRRFN
ncbi:hypothetical protein LJC22_01540 [Desulfosarcina sp. OttesenSCG-928-G10]|nr:hypothetical protein [Desulfosarcina sp. OttesenSCG-928-G10]MDL2320891.1 hypothetical protein [Desulfosarcina sp. OttesenSCG-928-B08]